MATDISRRHMYSGIYLAKVIDQPWPIPVYSDICRALEIVVRSFKTKYLTSSDLRLN